MKQTCVIIGGCKPNMYPVVHEFERRGVETIILTPRPDEISSAPQAHELDRAGARIVRIGGLNDPQEIMAAIDGVDVVAVYSPFDEALEVTARVRSMLGLPSAPVETISLILQKDRLRQHLREAGLSGLKSVPREAAATMDRLPTGGPWFFKPFRGAGSVGVRLVHDDAEFIAAQAALRDGLALEESPFGTLGDYIAAAGGYYLEEAFDGELLSVEAYLDDGRFQLIGVTRPLEIVDDAPPRRMPGCVFPAHHPLHDEIVALVRRAAESLDYRWGPIHVEVLVRSEGRRVEIVDFNPRVAGVHVTYAIGAAYGIRLERHLADWAMGLHVTIDVPDEHRFACLRYILAGPAETTLASMALPVGEDVAGAWSLKRVGALLTGNADTGSWVGGFIVTADTTDVAVHRAELLVREAVRINGRPASDFRTAEQGPSGRRDVA